MPLILSFRRSLFIEKKSIKDGYDRLINEKQIELLKVQIEEIKINTSNPLSSSSGN